MPDILWIDVQGAELLVLKGASQILNKVSLIYLEVSRWRPLYVEGAIFTDIETYLKKFGFYTIQLSLDSNGIGNALLKKKLI